MPTKLLALLLTIACLPMLGCSTMGLHTGGALTLSNLNANKTLTPTLATLAYLPVDAETADVYLSDLPAARLADPKDTLADAAGSIVHIHLFLIPAAGSTPIDVTACNVTIRYLLLAGKGKRVVASDSPVFGLYGGGGFILPDQEVGKDTFSGSIDQATYRLMRSTPGFIDLLGPGTLSGHFDAPRNDTLAKAIAAKIENLVRSLPPEKDEPKKSAPAKNK